MPQSTVVPLLTKGTHFVESFPDYALEYAPDMGFLVLPDEELPVGQVHVVGYQPVPPGTKPPEYSRSVTTFAELPPEERTRARQGQGVGTRLYNSPYAIADLLGYTGQLGVFATTIDRERMRREQEGMESVAVQGLSFVFKEGLRRLRAAEPYCMPLETAVQRIHRRYGDAQTVRLGKGSERVGGPVSHRFLILRDPSITLYGIGSLYTAMAGSST